MQVLDCHGRCENIHIHLSILLYCLFFLAPTTVFIYLYFQVSLLSQHYMDLPIIFLIIYYLSCPCHHIHLSIFFQLSILSCPQHHMNLCNFFFTIYYLSWLCHHMYLSIFFFPSIYHLLPPSSIQSMEVFSPPGTLIGSIHQEWSFCTPFAGKFTIKNAGGDALFRIEGPVCPCSCGGDVNFKVTTNTFCFWFYIFSH